MKNIIIGILYLYPFFVFSQDFFTIKGEVYSQKTPLLMVNILKSSETKNPVTTDEKGYFEIQNVTHRDTLIFWSYGYEIKKIPSLFFKKSEINRVEMAEKSYQLQELTVTARDPVSEKYAVIKLKPLDIYLNPMASADPLRAITSLPYSTNTKETADPELRGSDASRSIVIFNRVPISNPTRNTQINNLGLFSIFNTEMIEKQYVYASNPPLTYGNSSAGLVEIQTKNTLGKNEFQTSLHLLGGAVFLSQKITKKSFLQAYSNIQNSGLLIPLNGEAYKIPGQQVQNFYSTDFGANVHFVLSPKISYNSFLYFLKDGANLLLKNYNYEGDNVAQSQRWYSINNVDFSLGKQTTINLSFLIDQTKREYDFGNTSTKNNSLQTYTSLNIEHSIIKDWNIQTGFSWDRNNIHFFGNNTLYFYAIRPQDPTISTDTAVKNSNLEYYIYSHNSFLGGKFVFSTGVRLNIPLDGQVFYSSTQGSIRYSFHKQHSLLFSGGRYYNYAYPHIQNRKFLLQKSSQLALDYEYKGSSWEATLAGYYKREETEGSFVNNYSFLAQQSQTNIWGAELFLKKNLNSLTLTLSNSFIRGETKIGENYYKTSNSLNYFIKASVLYFHKIANLSLTYTTRPGTYETPVINSFPQNDYYIPIFGNRNSYQLGEYHNVSVNINKIFPLGKRMSGLVFFTANNILNTKNQSGLLFVGDFKNTEYTYLSQRTWFLGMRITFMGK